LRTDAAGGLSPEGFNYGPEALGRITQLLLAMRTAGEPSGRIGSNPFWRDFVAAVLHSLPPLPTRGQGELASRGQLWQPAFYGSTLRYWAEDFMKGLGPLALIAALEGDHQTADAVRWIETNVPPGGKAELLERVGDTDQFLDAILYFLLFDPNAGPPADPRPQLPLTHFAPGMNRLLARTCWCPDGRMFTYALSWNEIDHQRGDGNDFGFYRDGEWLTKQRAGYGSGASFTDYHNSVTIANDEPVHEDDERLIWKSGSQWVLDPAGDPRLVARSDGPGFVYATGDATNLYNSTSEEVTDVLHASRSIVWLQPDTIVVFDRAATRSDNRFKRFWLQLPAAPKITGNRAEIATRRQRLVVTSLLPEDGTIAAERDEDVGEPATGEPMRYRLRVEDRRRPRVARFLHVLQAVDRAASPQPVTLLQTPAGSGFTGATVGDTAVLFPVVLGAPFTGVQVEVPAQLERILITGLHPEASYTITATPVGGGTRLEIVTGGTARADNGGVLMVNPSRSS
jgi:hypothetical protein